MTQPVVDAKGIGKRFRLSRAPRRDTVRDIVGNAWDLATSLRRREVREYHSGLPREYHSGVDRRKCSWFEMIATRA